MASSLSQQLKKLATPQTGILDHKKKKSSVLFSASEAASHTRETFYQIGVSGFTELAEVNDDFTKFKDNLFGQKTKEFQRTIQTKDINEKLDKIIENFLLLLSPYLQKQAALKALEWLIHRFLINEMNVNSLMMCIFPYYETILFVRILQLVDIRSEQSPWKWLNRSQLKGRPIPKQTVFLHWASDQWFRNFVAKYFRKMMKIHKNEQNLQIATSLLISTQIGGLASAEEITENHLSSVCQTLQLCLSSDKNDVLSGMFLMISQLSISVNLSRELLEEIIQKVIKISNSAMIEHSAVCLLTIFYHQRIKEFSPSVLTALEGNEALMEQICKLSLNKPVSPFFSPFAKDKVKSILSDENINEEKKKKKLNHLIDLIQAMPLSPQEASKIIRSFFRGISECEVHLKAFKNPIKFVDMLKKLEASHPEGFDKASTKIMKAHSTASDDIAFAQQIIKAFNKKWVLNVKSPKVNKKLKGVKKVPDEEEQWLECLKPWKTSASSRAFLEKVCSTINLPEKKKTFPFWQITGRDEFSSSVKMLIKLVKVLVAHQIQNDNSTTYEMLLKQIFIEKLGKTKVQIYFLSMIWGWNLEAGDVGIDQCLKLWALNLTSALLTSSEPGSSSLSWVLDAKEPLIASLIIPICEGEFLCAAAFRVLEAMRSIVGGRLRANNLCVLIEELIQKKEEISADVSYLPATVSSLVAAKKGLGWKMVENLFACVTEPNVPLHIKSSVLYALSEVHNAELFSQLIPIGNSLLDEVKLSEGEMLNCASSSCLYYILLRFSSDDAMFLKIKGGWDLFQRSLEISDPLLQVTGQRLSPQELVVNYKLLQGLCNSNRKLEVLEVLISRIVRTKNSNEASKLSKELKKISLEASQIIAIWNKYDLVPNVKSVKEARAKRLKILKERKSESNSESWHKLELLIELIGVMAELKHPWLLIGPICDHLQVLMKLESSFADTLQQQMLSVCYHLLKLSSNQLDKEEFVKRCKLNVAVIVQCIRSSVNPDTHRRSLLILSLASNYFPEQVLHNIMAIFTFMGTSLLRRDDSYSFHVIHLTISSIVPTLIQAESSDPKLLLKKLSQVTQVFVDALPDLAEHRRLPLFKQLATTLGVSQYLWLVMVLIADAYVAHGTTSEEVSSQEDEPRRLPRNIHFALVLYSQFSIIDQLKASCELIDFICSLPEDKETFKGSQSSKELKNRNPSTLVINIETRTSRQLRQLKYTCVGLLVHLLSSEKFVGQVYESSDLYFELELEELKSLYKILLEKTLHYLKLVSRQEQLQKGNQSGRFWSAMQRKLMDLVDAVNSLLPPLLLIEVISNLLGSSSGLIRCRAMEILASKLQPDVKFFKNEEIKNLLHFIDPLRKVAMNVKEQESNRQTAFFTLQLLVKRLNSLVDSELILPILESSSSLIKRGDPSTKVITQAILVVAETVHVLKVFSLVHLDKLVPALLSILNNSVKEEMFNLDNLIIATAAALQRVVENVPRLLPSEDLEALFMVSCQLISKQEEEGQKDSRLTSRLTSTLEQLVHTVEMRILIPVLTKTYNEMSAVSLFSLPSLMSVIESLIGSVKISQLIMFKPSLIALFTKALELRSLKHADDVERVEHTEGCVISALTRFLLKLNEDDNTRIFSSLLNWAWDQMDENPTRLITFFRFADHHAGSLKVLFIKAKLAKNVFDYAAQVLERNNNLLHEHTIFGSGMEAENKASQLLKYVLEMLTKIFIYDSVQFTTEENFNLIVEPLTNQIENTLGSDDDYKARISDHLKTCVIRFTKAVGDDSLWKELNRQILLRVRTDNDSKVILAGLEIFEGLVEALGEDYLQPLLADTIPYITEVLESFDVDIEKKTREIFNKMEAILGDSLRAYLDT